MFHRMLHRNGVHGPRFVQRLVAVSAGFVLSGLPISHSLHALPRHTAPELAAISEPGSAARAHIAFPSLPLSFEANQGQTDPRVDFIGRGPGYTVFLKSGEAVLALHGAAGSKDLPTSAKPSAAVLRLQLVGANVSPRGAAGEQLSGSVNYLRGKDTARWRTHIPTYSKVRYPAIYPGIDLLYYGTQRQLEYDFIVRPGADPERIVVRVDGADKIVVDPDGDLVLTMSGASIRQRTPVIYQDIDGIRRQIAGGYVLRGVREVGFRVAAYDTSRPLVIDPVLFYSSYLGGAINDDGGSVAVDADGNAYITGRTSSTDFPTTVGAVRTSLTGPTDAFVTKLDPAGAVVYSTYLGGIGDEEARSIAVDGAGNVYMIGDTTSADFPTTAGAFQTIAGGLIDAFVTKLDPSGSALLYSTYLGGSGEEETRGVAIDQAGSAYVVGDTTSANFPTTAGAFRVVLSGLSDAFATKLDSAGAALVYSTYLGGAGAENGLGIAVDGAGNAYVTGDTTSADFPTTAGVFRTTLAGMTDAFVSKLNATGAALVWSTYLGGTREDRGFAIAIDAVPSPNVYVTGRTLSTNFPATVGAFRGTLAGQADTFVSKLNAAGSALVYSTYLGGGRDDVGRGIAVDAAGSAYIIGQTASSDWPITAGALQATLAGIQDALVTKLNATGSALVYSTYFGGTGAENGRSIVVDAAGSAYVTGKTTSTDFPTTAGAFDSTFNGLDEAFAAKIADFGPPATLTLAPDAASSPVGTQHCVTATVQDAAGNAVRSLTVRFSVTGANTISGSARTDATGNAAFCYTGTNVGNDAITAFADTNNNSAQNPGEPGDTATNTWVAS